MENHEQLQHPEGYSVSCEVEVRFRDLDAMGHVNNAVWVDFIVQLADAHSSSLGFDRQAIRSSGGLWVVRRHEIDYLSSALPGQELTEETWIHSLRGARSIRHSRFSLEQDGAALVTAVTHWAFCDPLTQRPRRVPREMLSRLPVIERS